MDTKTQQVFDCSRCRDTHQVETERGQQMCTSCPTPCDECRGLMKDGGFTAYCGSTPCRCGCHVRRAQALEALIHPGTTMEETDEEWLRRTVSELTTVAVTVTVNGVAFWLYDAKGRPPIVIYNAPKVRRREMVEAMLREKGWPMRSPAGCPGYGPHCDGSCARLIPSEEERAIVADWWANLPLNHLLSARVLSVDAIDELLAMLRAERDESTAPPTATGAGS
jgi:hypothetical protein